MTNGGFESPLYDRAPFYGYAPANADWAWSGMAGVQRNGSGLGAAGAPAGAQTAFLQGSSTAGNQGALAQNVTLAAGTYKVTFAASQRATGAGVPIQIEMDGTALGAPIVPAGTSFANYASAPFKVNADGSTYRLRFSTDSTSGVAMSLIDAIAIEAVPYVSGGGFETPVTDRSPFYGYTPASSGWTWDGMAGIQRNGSLGANAPEGVQTAFLQGGSNPGVFSQFLFFPAGSYQIKFKAAQRGTGNGVPIQVSVDNNSSFSGPVSPSSTAFATYATSGFGVTAGNHLLKFSTPSTSGVSMSLIDDITVEPVGAAPVVLPTPWAPAAPTGLAASFEGDQVTLTWNAVGNHPTYGTPLYKVKRGTAPGGPYATLAPAPAVTTLTDRVAIGPTYYYRVYAYNAANSGADSSEVSVTPLAAPATPTLSGAVTADGKVSLSWNGDANATRYTLDRYDGNSQLQQFVNLTGQSFVDNTVTLGQTYRYRLTGFNQSVSGPVSNEVIVRALVPPAKPTLSGTATPDGKVSLSWNGDANATRYTLDRYDSNSQLRQFINLTGQAFVDNTVTPGQTYRYFLTGFNQDATSPVSNEVVVTLLVPPAKPTLYGTATTDGKVRLDWNGDANATRYTLDRYDSNSQLQQFVNLTGQSYEDRSVSLGQTYRYFLTGFNQSVSGSTSNDVVVTAKALVPPAKPTLQATVTADGNVRLDWNGDANATRYTLDRYDSNSQLQQFVNLTGQSFVDNTVTLGQTYRYRLTGFNYSVMGPVSNEVVVTVVVPAPTPVPTAVPTPTPTVVPTPTPTVVPTPVPTVAPTPVPTAVPTPTPTAVPTPVPTAVPTPVPTAVPTPRPTSVAPSHGVDLSIEALTNPAQGEIGVDFYFPDEQQADFSIASRPGAATFRVTLRNTGNATDNFRLSGRGDAPGWKVSYFDSGMPTGGADISAQVKSNTYPVSGLGSLNSRSFRVVMTLDATVPISNGTNNGAYPVPISAYAEDASFVRDQVTAKSIVESAPPPSPVPDYKVDAAVRVASQIAYVGEKAYSPTVQAVSGVASSSTAAVYNLKVTNRGTTADNFQVKLPVVSGWSLSLYDALDGGTNVISAAQQNSGFETGSLAPSKFREFRIEVKPTAGITAPLSIQATVAFVANANINDVCTLNTTVGTVAAKPVVSFALLNGGEARACAGGIDNALHQITLTLHASSNGADLKNTSVELSFENNIGHNYSTTGGDDFRHKAKIRDPNNPAIPPQEILTLVTDGNGNIPLTVLSSDVISQMRLIARIQNATVGGINCEFAAVTSKRGVPDPTVGEYPNWQDDDNGWTCNVSNLVQQGDTVEGKVYIKCKDGAGVLQPVVGHKIKVFVKSAGLGGDNAVYDPDEMLAYLGFIGGSGTVQSSVEVTTIADGSATFSLKANAGAETLRRLNFGGEDQSQWRN